MYYRGTMPRTGSDDGKVGGGGGALPVEERVEADGTVYIVTKTKRGREVKTLKSKWEQEQASIARKKTLKEKSLLRQKERGGVENEHNSELCSICREHECAASFIQDLERAEQGNGTEVAAKGSETPARDAGETGGGAPPSPTNVQDGPSPSDLLMCDGPCLRSFHIGCIESSDNALPEVNFSSSDHVGKKWYCNDCDSQSYECAVCHNYGARIVPGGKATRDGVKKCTRDDCGRFFHPKCLQELQEKFVSQISSNSILENDAQTKGFKEGECPAHTCATCGTYERMGAGRGKLHRLYCCGSCPTAYHWLCITPFCQANKSHVNCPDHFGGHLPRPHFRDVKKELMQAERRRQKEEKRRAAAARKEARRLERERERQEREELRRLKQVAKEERDRILELKREERQKEIERLRELEAKHQAELAARVVVFPDLTPFFPRTVPRTQMTQDKGHFRLKKSIITEVNSKPHPFKKIRKNIYLRSKPKINNMEDAGTCTCTSQCVVGKCSNSQLFMECCEALNTKIGSNCNVGKGNCLNRRLQDRAWANTKPFNTHTHGWGLKANEDIKSGSLIIEYNGEVVNEVEANRRLAEQKENGDRHVYMMQLSNDCVIDARHRGNISRLINHSCDPNCQLQRWVVGTETRIAIVAIKNLSEGVELTYDYQLSANEEFKCLCGTKKCRGTLRAIVGQVKEANELRQQKKEEKHLSLVELHEKRGWIKRKDMKRIEKENAAREKKMKEIQEQRRKGKKRRLNLFGSRYVPSNRRIEIDGEGGRAGGGKRGKKSKGVLGTPSEMLQRNQYHDASHEIKDGPTEKDYYIMQEHASEFPKSASKVFLWRNVRKGANFLQRWKLRTVDVAVKKRKLLSHARDNMRASTIVNWQGGGNMFNV